MASDFWRELDDIAEAMGRESDRSAIILGAARLDALLEELLAAVFVPSPDKKDRLLQGDGPLSSFGARIRIAHRLGLVSEDLARALHMLREIRNEFAHTPAINASLSTLRAQGDRAEALVTPFRVGTWPKLVAKFGGYGSGTSGIQAEIRASIAVMIMSLEAGVRSATRVSAADAIWLVPKGKMHLL